VAGGETPIEEMVRADLRMLATLGGKMPTLSYEV